MRTYSKILDVLEKITKVVIAILFVVLIVSMTYQVIMRYVFNAANSWSEELARYAFIYIVLLGAGIATRHSSHLQVDFIINLFKGRAKCIYTILTLLVALFFLVFFCYQGLLLGKGTGHSISAGLKVPMSYVYASIPAGSILMILASVELILKNIQEFISFGKNKGGEST